MVDSCFVSYSQHGEDCFVWEYFKRKEKGIIIEVGAFDGVHLSNSYSLENLGWMSICIEPNPEIFKLLDSNRPQSLNFQCAIVEDEKIEEIEFYSEKLGLLSGTVMDIEDVRRRYERRNITYVNPLVHIVPARTLNSIIESFIKSSDQIDCISIDVEGAELDVLKGLDLSKYCPKLLIIEANDRKSTSHLINYLRRANYKLIKRISVNLIFIPQNHNFSHINLEYIPAKQKHPLGLKYTIQPKIIKSKHWIIEKYSLIYYKLKSAFRS